MEFTRTLRPGLVLAIALAVLVLPGSGRGAPNDESKPFPYDPVCPWGRVANGKGFLIRCLSQTEAATLGVPGAQPLKKDEGSDGEAADSPDDPESTPPDEDAPDESEADGEAEGEEEPPEEASETIEIELGPAIADTGSLPKAVASLSKAKDRYLECITENGGMFRDEGELHVRFLVRGRGRAEGPTVKKRRSITEAAGKCIADVVDRRFVGYPDAEIVGATLVMKFKKGAR